jgi:flagellar hook-length control protein FliK
MQQHVFIQTDAPVASGLAKKASNNADKSSAEAFSAELDKQIQPQAKTATAKDKSGQVDTADKKAEAAKPVETEKNTLDDGNSLPPEEQVETAEEKDVSNDESSVQAETAESQEQVQVAVDTDAEQNTDISTSESQEGAETSDSQPVTAQSGNADKPIRAQVEVSQKAVENAKAAPVEMTARPKPEASLKGQATAQPAIDSETSDESTVSNTKNSNTVQTRPQVAAETAVQLPKNIEKLLSESEKTASTKAVPNFATALETKTKSEVQPQSIRADILDALQRNTGNKDIVQNLRNQTAMQMEQSSKTDMSKALLSAERPVIDKPMSSTPLLTAATSASPLLTSTTTPSSSVQTISLPIQPTIQNPAWTKVMSSRVVYLAKEGIQQAELRMTPANLGPVEVRLQLHNEQANVTFLAQHSATRDALEQALPKLRESFAEAGIELGQAEVGEQQHQQGDEAEHAQDLHIFTQAKAQSDDIETEEQIEQPSGETTAGLSIYA